VILPMKSRLADIEVQLILRAREHGTTTDLDKVGTPHFAQFVPLEDNQIGFFTVYDGDLDKCSELVLIYSAKDCCRKRRLLEPVPC
jgi:hypothetical protein